MPRRSAVPTSKLDRTPVPSWVRALPWVAIVQGGVAIGRRWRALSAKDRARLTRLLRESRGSVGNLSIRQRLELRALVRRLDLAGLGRELLPLARDGRGRRRGRGKRCRKRA
jgi:hypothetical protein